MPPVPSIDSGASRELAAAKLLEAFEKQFSGTAAACFYAPGRVNLIGEYTDFNGGLVLPCAIDYGTWLAIAPGSDEQLHFHSTSFADSFALTPVEQSQAVAGRWSNYPLGVIDQFRRKGYLIGGLRCLFHGNVPSEAGLSSSASIAVCTAVAINRIFNCGAINWQYQSKARARR